MTDQEIQSRGICNNCGTYTKVYAHRINPIFKKNSLWQRVLCFISFGYFGKPKFEFDLGNYARFCGSCHSKEHKK